MTTGRINQVTIVAGPAGARARVDGSDRGVQRARPAGGGPAARATGASLPSSICHDRIPQGEVRPHTGGRGPPGARIVAPRGGSPSPVTPEGGYRYTGVPPSVSRIIVAIGQLSTDSFSAE